MSEIFDPGEEFSMGQPIPNGFKIKRINPKNVIVEHDDALYVLEWAEEGIKVYEFMGLGETNIDLDNIETEVVEFEEGDKDNGEDNGPNNLIDGIFRLYKALSSREPKPIIQSK